MNASDCRPASDAGCPEGSDVGTIARIAVAHFLLTPTHVPLIHAVT